MKRFLFLVDWGINFVDWVLPFSSAFLTFALLCSIAGFVYVTLSRPFDIGDRILICNPGNKEGFEQYHATTIQNFVVRKFAVVNLQRSKAQTVSLKLQVPARTGGERILQFLDAVQGHVTSSPQDWVCMQGSNIGRPDYVNGVIDVSVYVLSAHAFVRGDLSDHAKSRLLLFVHVYMQATGLQYCRPTQEVTAILTQNETDGWPE
ncbi:hypothetical protein T492DRAFT_882696 [Pavlovales sp. CCMP2436]|nr:hypothetical protein T492DRAFT_882696 [Pavlovales sp. CCMP2436]